jgi:hypothetical protein
MSGLRAGVGNLAGRNLPRAPACRCDREGVSAGSGASAPGLVSSSRGEPGSLDSKRWRATNAQEGCRAVLRRSVDCTRWLRPPWADGAEAQGTSRDAGTLRLRSSPVDRDRPGGERRSPKPWRGREVYERRDPIIHDRAARRAQEHRAAAERHAGSPQASNGLHALRDSARHRNPTRATVGFAPTALVREWREVRRHPQGSRPASHLAHALKGNRR